MTTLTDLRRTLDRHADEITRADPATAVRAVSVHRRIAARRRRRRAAGAGALAVAVIGGLAAAQLRPTPEAGPAAPVLLGQRAPETIRSLGYVYRTTGRGAAFGRQGTLDVASSTRPRLVSWTTDGAAAVRLTLPDHTVVHSSLGHFRDFAVIPPGAGGRLRVAVATGRVGLATYALTGAAPAGYTADGVTYRRTVAGESLLAARIGAEGRAVLATSYVAPRGWVSVHLMCSGLPSGAVVNVSLDGQGRVSGGSCDSDGGFDPGAGGDVSLPAGRPGRTVRVRVWVSAGYHDPTPLDAAATRRLRLGVGVYGPLHQQRVGGDLVPTTLEQDGHTYRLVSWRDSAGAPLRLPAAPVDRLATMAWHTHGPTEVSLSAGSSSPEGGSYTAGQAAIPGVWVPAGSPVRARLDKGTGTFGVALYERVG